MKLIYAALARIPSEKAHPYQIVQMCEAFATAGADVTLLYANRHNPPALRTDDIWAHYGISRNFTAGRLFCLDLFPLVAWLPYRPRLAVERVLFLLQVLTFSLALLLRLAREKDAVLYSRDPIILLLFALVYPRRARLAFYEAHVFSTSSIGRWLREKLAARLGGVVVITEALRQRYAGLMPPPALMLVAHDGIRQARFAVAGDQAAWRNQFGWPEEAFIVGYLGRFYSGVERMDKGLDLLLEAVIGLAGEVERPVRLALVGGPAERVDQLREDLAARGVLPDFILYPGQVPAEQVPGYLRAFDVCTIPSPWTEFYAYYTSPMKLFEYMASGRPLVASDLPSTAEIIRDRENGLLVPHDRPAAWQAAFRRLLDDPAFAARLADQAGRDVLNYTWAARAKRILTFMKPDQED